MQLFPASHVAGRFVFLDMTAPGEGAVSLEVAPLFAPIDSSNPASPSSLHLAFLNLVPLIETHGRVVFRFLKCQDQREDALAEMLALSWRWFVRLVQQGKDPTAFPTAIATFAARAVKSGRRLARMERPQDVLSQRAQRLHGFRIESLPIATRASHENLFASPHGQKRSDAFEERLRDNTITPVPEQVSFRLDFPAWLQTRTYRDRRVIEDLLAGERTIDVADKHGLTAGRISQLRRDFMEDWQRFTGDPDDKCQPPA